MNERTSLKDIAIRLGVSTAVVSYVLNGKEKKNKIGDELVRKVKQLAKELDYQPNHIARSLKRGATHTIGLIVADISNPFFAQLARVIEDAAMKIGYTVLFGSVDENANKSALLIQKLLDWQVDGFVVVPTEGSSQDIASIMDKNIPLVLIDRYFPNINSSYVCLNNYAATFEATTYLINNRCKDITLVVVKSDLIHMKERIQGYTSALQLNGLENYVNVIELPYQYTREESVRCIAECLSKKSKIDALVCATAKTTLSSLTYVTNLGIKVPDDIKIIGFDGGDAFDFFYSPVSYIEQPLFEIGNKAVNILVNKLEGKTDIIQEILKPVFHIRQSSR